MSVLSEVGWQELTRSECFGLLSGQQLGRVVLVDDRGPIALPVNFVLDRHTVLFRTDEGTKLDVAGRGAPVAFEVDGAEEATRTGWSVLVRGEATEVTDPDDLARVRQLPLYPLGARRQDPLRADPVVLADRAAYRGARRNAVAVVGLAAARVGVRIGDGEADRQGCV